MRWWRGLAGIGADGAVRGVAAARAAVVALGVAVMGVVSAAAVAGCSDSTPEEGNARETAIVEQVVRLLAGEPSEEGDLPVVFVVGIDGTIGIDVQAGVAAALVDEIDVRFADERQEAMVDTDDEGRVRDGGVLLLVQDIPAEGRSIDIEVDRYRTLEDWDRVIVSLRFQDPAWSVTSTSIAETVGD